jgi:hypothetical protein
MTRVGTEAKNASRVLTSTLFWKEVTCIALSRLLLQCPRLYDPTELDVLSYPSASRTGRVGTAGLISLFEMHSVAGRHREAAS